MHEKDDENNLHIKMVKILTGSRFFFDLTEDTEERRAHPMDIQRLLPETQYSLFFHARFFLIKVCDKDFSE